MQVKAICTFSGLYEFGDGNTFRKSGKKDNEDFWIKMGDKFVYIRYFAVRDKDENFSGVLEVTQDIKPIQAITGEKRITD